MITYERTILLDAIQQVPNMISIKTTDVPLAGSYATVNLCINNHGFADMDILVNTDNGSGPGDVSLSIFNKEGLEISRTAYKGSPVGAVAVGDKTFLTIPAGGKKCFDVQILVPVNLEDGDKIHFVAGLKNFYTYDGSAGTTLSGRSLNGQLSSGIKLTDYYGTAQTDKPSYTNDEPIVITGPGD